ncbi:hypothetical protein PR202_gb21677 [Eleusine coracana subsp. coracana]|uniref:Uncharacterized protein n=1 Tax=Eleusine coracana subsp. coracana TaxID=191504 RepID=A0AAV5FE82_ELECO|nr:hypothetical protein QOZ80_7BG0608830 [Eleusine coracana subsp. coracana]GJN33111.1 hypothetical protein PR202_gb21677 [Eleusine coracana subsp. coracana]
MEVMVPVMAPSAPCSPRTAGGGGDHLPGYCYFFSSAPTSPSRASYAAGDAAGDGETFDFTLGFSGQLHEASPILAAADELFEGGRIRPLNTPHPSVVLMADDASSSSYSFRPRSPRRGDHDHQAAASERGRSGRPSSSAAAIAASSASSSSASRSRRATRSLSPFRGGGDEESSPSSPPSPRTSMMRGCGSGSKKWRLKDLFLFRSASEGRATGGSKDPLLKYTMLSSSSTPSFSQQKVVKQAGGGDGSASMRKGRGSTASASDMPYTVNRAAAEDVRRRTTTPLPFHRNSLFGYLRSNPAIHSISRKLGNHSSSSSSSSSRGRAAAA